MNVIHIIEAALAVLIPVVIAGVIGWVKINRQVETLETKFEGMEKEMQRHDNDLKDVIRMFAEIKNEITSIRLLLAANQIN